MLLLIYYEAVTGLGFVSFPTSDVARKSLAFGFYFTMFVWSRIVVLWGGFLLSLWVSFYLVFYSAISFETFPVLILPPIPVFLLFIAYVCPEFSGRLGDSYLS